MDQMNFPKLFEFIVKIGIPIISAIIAIVGFGIKTTKDNYTSKKSKLEGIKDALIKRQEIEKSHKFVQDLTVNANPIFKGFNWLEVNYILQRDIGIKSIENLKSLSKRDLIALHDNKIIIPKRRYIIIEHLKDPISWLLLISFAIGFITIFISLYCFPESFVQNSFLVVFTIISEVLLINRFDDLLSHNAVIKSTNFEGNEIEISENFKNCLKEYKKFQLKHYSIERLSKIQANAVDNINIES